MSKQTKLLPKSHCGVYQLDFSCNMEDILANQRKNYILTHCIEHQQDRIKGKWESSGATEHNKENHGQFN